jgi:hypothetical protein
MKFSNASKLLFLTLTLGMFFASSSHAKPYRKYKWRCKFSIGWSAGPRIKVGCSEVLREPNYANGSGSGSTSGSGAVEPKYNNRHNSELTSASQIQAHPYLTAQQKSAAITLLNRHKLKYNLKHKRTLSM